MTLTSEMLKAPEDFIKSHVMIVPGSTDEAVRKLDFKLPQKFKLVGIMNACFVDVGEDGTDSISAFFLPWEESKTTVLALSSKARFFFTSQLTNCRFSIAKGSGSDITVAHTAGNISGSGGKAKAEKEAGFETDLKKIKRLSVTGGIVKGIHQYRGQTGGADASSGFVFGILEGGSWKFMAQITEGVRNETKTTDITSDLKILEYYSIPG